MFFKKKVEPKEELIASDLKQAMRDTLLQRQEPVRLEAFDELVQLVAIVSAIKWQAQKMYLLHIKPATGESFAKKPNTGVWTAAILTICDAAIDSSFRRRIRERFPKFDIENDVDCMLGARKDLDHANLFLNQICNLAPPLVWAIHKDTQSPLGQYFQRSSSWEICNSLVLWARLGLNFDPDSTGALIPENLVYALAGDDASFNEDVWSNLENASKIVIAC